jgi:hypothetical protein
MAFLCLLAYTLISTGFSQPASNFDTQNVQPNTPFPTRTLRPDNTSEAKTTDTKPNAEEKPHILPPFSWGPNNEYKLQFGGDTRIRLENRHNWDLQRETGDNDKLGLVRTRLNWDMTWCNAWRAFVEILDGREIDAAIHQNQEDYFDLHQAFLEYKEPAPSPWSIRVGRQEIELGRDKRLVESANWQNLRRTFDGARLMYRSEDVDNDTFLTHADYYDHQHGNEIVSDHVGPRRNEWFYGTYFTLKQFKPHTLEAYFLGLSDTDEHRTFPRDVKSEEGRFGTTDRYTVGSALYGPLWKGEGCGTLSYGTEAAYQFGHRSNDDIDAWMFHGDLNYQWDEPFKPKLSLIGNLASGDREKGDGVTNTFSPLFGAAHTPYGIIDVVRLQNLREAALVGSVEPTDKLKAQLEFHRFWLDSKTDAWYDGRNSNTLGRDANGRSGRELGDELDAILTYKATRFVTLEGGLAHFFANGSFAQNVNRDTDSNLLYLQTTISF